MQILRSVLAPVLIAIAALLMTAPLAAAEVLTVTRIDDPPPGACLADDCSLREAVNASNGTTTVDDRIVLPANANPYQVGADLLSVSDQVEISGAGPADTTIRGTIANPVLRVASPGVTITGVTVTEGKTGILNDGALTLRRVTIFGNKSEFQGGGIQSNGSLTIEFSSISFNESEASAGGIQSNGPLTIESSFLGSNKTKATAGGAIQVNETATIVNSTFFANTSKGASAINANGVTTVASSAFVGNRSTGVDAPAIGDSKLSVRDSIFSDNLDETGLDNCEATSLGGNVENGANCATGPTDRPNAEVGLGELLFHGGTTLVFDLLSTSAAVDAAGDCPALDQRGGPRPLGEACDSGPFESTFTRPRMVTPPADKPVVKPADKAFLVELGGGKLFLDPKNKIALHLTCPASEATPPCAGTVTLRTKTKVAFGGTRQKQRLGLVRFALAAGQSKAIVVKLPSLKAELVRDLKPSRRIEVEVSAADGAGNATALRQTRTVLVRLAPPF